jgi:hypothetical protein
MLNGNDGDGGERKRLWGVCWWVLARQRSCSTVRIRRVDSYPVMIGIDTSA